MNALLLFICMWTDAALEWQLLPFLSYEVYVSECRVIIIHFKKQHELKKKKKRALFIINTKL